MKVASAKGFMKVGNGMQRQYVYSRIEA